MARRPSVTPRAGSPGTVGDLKPWTSPVASSSRLKSVNVPPMSMPSRYGGKPHLPLKTSYLIGYIQNCQLHRAGFDCSPCHPTLPSPSFTTDCPKGDRGLQVTAGWLTV